MNDKIGLIGNLRIDHISNGNVNTMITHNDIIDTGRGMISNLLVGDVTIGSRYGYMAIGLGSSTISGNQTTLGSEYLRLQMTGSTVTGSIFNDTAQFIGSFHIDATKTVNEAGLFNWSGLDAGSMLSRSTDFTEISATSGDWINITWNVKVI